MYDAGPADADAYRAGFARMGWTDLGAFHSIAVRGGSAVASLGEPIVFAPVNGRPGMPVAALVDGHQVLGRPWWLRRLSRHVLGVTVAPRRSAEGEVTFDCGRRSIAFRYREPASSLRATLLRPLRQFVAIRSNFSGHPFSRERQQRWIFGDYAERKEVRTFLKRFAEDATTRRGAW
jgi:hypothetical protein